MSRRRRISEQGASALQQLKDLTLEEQEFLLAQRKHLSVKKLLAHIEGRHRIFGLSPQRWSDFVKWFEEEGTMESAGDSVQHLREMATKGMSLDDLHEWLRDLLLTTGLRDKDVKTLKFITQEVRKIMELVHSRDKWKEEQRAKIDAGLDAIFQDIKGDAVAVELFEKITARIRPQEQST